jgi:ABC-type cobalamin/Fe3+-siderophores transport system ATPase subunit
VAFVAQRPAVPAAMRVREVVQLGRLRLGPDAATVQRAMQATGVDAMQHAWMEHLSEGQRHRVAVARALAQRNANLRMLAVDEPTASLDPAWAASLARLLREVAAEGVSVFVATHDFAFAAACCTHAVLLDGGRVVGAGAFAAVMQPDSLAGVFGVPFARVQGVCQQPVTLPVW